MLDGVLTCAECGEVIVGDPHVERIDDRERDGYPELAFLCRRCAEYEFVAGTGPPGPRLPPPRVP